MRAIIKRRMVSYAAAPTPEEYTGLRTFKTKFEITILGIIRLTRHKVITLAPDTNPEIVLAYWDKLIKERRAHQD